MDGKRKLASLAENNEGKKVIQIEFPYDLDLLEKIRSIPGRKYHSEASCWSAPFFIDTITKLRNWGFTIDKELGQYVEKKLTKEDTIVNEGIPGLKGKLYPYQLRGVSVISNNKGRLLLADEMGLGKTIQAIGWLQMNTDKRPVIIIVPASLKLNWEKEIQEWMTKPSVEVLSGIRPWKTKAEILIINYDIVPNWKDELRRRKPSVIITDECHYYKSNSARRTKAIKLLAKRVPHFIAISGTPVINRPVEAYNAIKIIDPNLFDNYYRFVRRYCNAKNNGFGLDVNGHSHTQELHNILTSTIMLRRTKEEVLPDLPPKVRSFVPLHLTNKEDYLKAEDDFLTFILDEKGYEASLKAEKAKAFVEIETLKQLSVQGKIKHTLDWIHDFLASDQKLVVFATHRFVIDQIMNEFSKVAVKIDGSVASKDRQAVVERFQTDDTIRLFVGNIKAAGVGITLTAASNVAFLELPWTPGEVIQAEDRCHRIGQKDCVNIYFLLAANTIENKIAMLLDRKRKVLDSILDGKDTEDDALLTLLIKQYRDERKKNG